MFPAESETQVTLINQVWRARPCSDLAWWLRAWRGLAKPAPGEWRRRARPRIGRAHDAFTPTCRACWATPKRPDAPYVAASTDPTRLEER